jgi:hypothetical protein
MASQGRIPRDLRRRLDHATGDWKERFVARWLGDELAGADPASVPAKRRCELRARWGLTELEFDRCLALLTQVGYGQRPAPKRRCDRAHGRHLAAQLAHVDGVLPRALALRLPTTANTHATEPPGRGVDRWGEISCNTLLRAKHVGALAVLFGAWRSRADRDDLAGYLSVGKLAHMLQQHRYRGGRDLAWVYQTLVELEQLRVCADVDLGEEGHPSEAHRIPEDPLFEIEHLLDGEWLSLADCAAALGDQTAAGRCGRHDTLRIIPSPWVRAELTREDRAPVFLHIAVWRSLRPFEQRLYAFLQAQRAVSGGIYFFLAAPDRFTLGLRERRLDRCAATVREALTNIAKHDKRYAAPPGRVAFQEGRHGRTDQRARRYPSFTVFVNTGRASSPTVIARAMKSQARRPVAIRGLSQRLAERITEHDVDANELDSERLARDGERAARVEAAARQRAIAQAYAAARLADTQRAAITRSPSPRSPSAGPAP